MSFQDLTALGTGVQTLIAADDTEAIHSVTAAETDVKTYALADNIYSYILAMASVAYQVDNAGSTQSVTAKMYIGATTKNYTFRSGSLPAANFTYFGRACMLTAAQQSAATIKITVNAGADSPNDILRVHNLYIWGIT